MLARTAYSKLVALTWHVWLELGHADWVITMMLGPGVFRGQFVSLGVSSVTLLFVFLL